MKGIIRKSAIFLEPYILIGEKGETLLSWPNYKVRTERDIEDYYTKAKMNRTSLCSPLLYACDP